MFCAVLHRKDVVDLIKVYIDGNELRQSDKNGGVCGELNSTEMLLSFGEDWSGYAKKVVFWNAYGCNPVEILLTGGVATSSTDEAVSLPLEGKASEREEYIIKIPGEALEFEGEAEYVVVGTVVESSDGEEPEIVAARKKSVAGEIRVRRSPSAEGAEVPEEISATVAEQLQAEAERISTMANNMVPYIGDNGHWIVYNSETKEWEDTGVIAKGEKGDKGVPGNTPYIGEDGYWYVVDMNMGVKAQGDKGDAGAEGPPGPQGEVGPQGEKGEKGDKGENGDSGYTPQKGVDYWTEEDKAEIKKDLQESGGGSSESNVFIAEFEEIEEGSAVTTEASASDIYYAHLSGKLVFAKLDLSELIAGKLSVVTLPLTESGLNAYEFCGTVGTTTYNIKRTLLNNELQYSKTPVESSGGSDLFVIQWNGTSGDKTYAEVSQAIKERKIPVLYQGDKVLATLSGESPGGIVFISTDIFGISTVTEYIVSEGGWSHETMWIVKTDYLDETISANNPDFKTAVLNCLPDADAMKFPLENTVSEVSEDE